MSEPMNRMYYLLYHDKRANGKMHKGVPINQNINN